MGYLPLPPWGVVGGYLGATGLRPATPTNTPSTGSRATTCRAWGELRGLVVGKVGPRHHHPGRHPDHPRHHRYPWPRMPSDALAWGQRRGWGGRGDGLPPGAAWSRLERAGAGAVDVPPGGHQAASRSASRSTSRSTSREARKGEWLVWGGVLTRRKGYPHNFPHFEKPLYRTISLDIA